MNIKFESASKGLDVRRLDLKFGVFPGASKGSNYESEHLVFGLGF
jgi:hypothetical protein